MITLTSSQQDAALKPATEPVLLVRQNDLNGTEWRFAAQPCSWSGMLFAPRILNAGAIQTAIGGAPGAISAPKTINVQFANADGWFSQKPPEWWRGQRMTVHEVFLDVPSDAVRTFKFTVTGARMNGPTFELDGEDILADVRRQLVPSNNVVMTGSRFYPVLAD